MVGAFKHTLAAANYITNFRVPNPLAVTQQSSGDIVFTSVT